MGASCSSGRDSLYLVDAIDDKNQSCSTLAEDPVLLEMGFDAEICRLYDVVVDSHNPDNNSLKVIRKDVQPEKSSSLLKRMLLPKNVTVPQRSLLLKRVTSDNPLSIMRWYHTLDVLIQLNHHGIPRVIDIHDEDHSRLSFVMETCEGGHILERTPRYCESLVRKIIRQILGIVHYLHSQDIVHGDLRAEWFQFVESSNPKDWRIQLTNFSMAQEVLNEESSPRPRLHHDHEPCLHTTSPQILLNGRPHSKQGDMWSVGVVLYRLLSGQRPFGDNTSDLLSNMRDGPTLAFQGPIWETISPQAKDLIQKLLVVEPKDRLSARQALRHGWVSSFISSRRRMR